MKIGLYNLEPHIVNTAMMQVSQYYKDHGYKNDDLSEKGSPLCYAWFIWDMDDLEGDTKVKWLI